jgi:hypothetical protein
MKLVVVGVICALAGTAVASPIERRLYSSEIEASSFLWNDWNKFVENYHPNYVADDDPTTAWVEGAPGSGAGEWIQIHLTPLDKTTHVRLHVRDGYQKSKSLFTANARAKQVTLRLLPSKATATATFADKDGWQDIAIDQPSGPITAVELHVDSVYEGTKYADMCISDIDVFATSETPDNPALENGKHKALLAWRAARLAAAKAFASGAQHALPIAESYAVTEPKAIVVTNEYPGRIEAMTADAAQDPVFASEWKDALAVATAVTGNLDKLPRAQLAPAANVALPEVDGTQLLADGVMFAPEGGTLDQHALRWPVLGTVASLFVDQLRVLDLADKQTPTAYANARGACGDGDVAWVQRAPAREAAAPAVVRAIVIGRCRRVETRDGHENVRRLEMMIYGVDGRLALEVGEMHADGYRWADVDGKPTLAGGHAMIAEGEPQVVDVTARKP